MFLLEADDDAAQEFKQAWMAIGDSIVVVGGDGLYNCHIHTDDIGGAIEVGIAAGRPSRIRVTDLLEEVAERDWVRAATEAAEPVGETVTTAVVAVGVGDGVAAIFRSLGAQVVVAGGQSMNPSTAELLQAVERAPGRSVVILPNNKNIVPVARQVDAHTDKTVVVVPTRTVAEGFAALVAYDPEAAAADNGEAMGAAAEHVVAGEITRAVRDAASPVGPVRTGDYIGLCDDGIVAIADDVVGATNGLLDHLVGDDHEILTVIAGEDAGEADTAAIVAWMALHRPDVEVEVHHGGQPLYAYYLGVE
jgi:hypothetical protein